MAIPNILNTISYKKLEICSELISHAKNGKINDEIIVFIGNYKNIYSLLFNNLNVFKIMSIVSYDENNLSHLNRNIILIGRNINQIERILSLKKKLLILDISDYCLENVNDNIINHIVRGSQKYEKFNIKNKNAHLAYGMNNSSYANFQNIFEEWMHNEYA